MPAHDSLQELSRDVPFEVLVDALREGRDLSAWNVAFGKVLERVRAAVCRRFPDDQRKSSSH